MLLVNVCQWRSSVVGGWLSPFWDLPVMCMSLLKSPLRSIVCVCVVYFLVISLMWFLMSSMRCKSSGWVGMYRWMSRMGWMGLLRI